MIDLGLGVCHPWQNDEGVTGPHVHDVQRAFPDQLWYNYKWDLIGADNYVPMVWNPTRMFPDPMLLHGNVGAIWLWGNEPEDEDQGVMSPEEAAKAWEMWVESTRSLGVLTIGPNVQWGTAGSSWLDAWLDLIKEPPDVLGVHIYWAENADQYMSKWDQVRNWRIRRGLESSICITETNAYAYPGVQATGVQLLIAQLVRDDPILCGAFWFSTNYSGWTYSNLMTKDGGVTTLGENWRKFNQYAGGGGHNAFLPYVQS